MSGWPSTPSRAPRKNAARRALLRSTVRALCATAVGTALLAGCGALPGGGSPEEVTVMTFAPVGTDATNMPGMPAMAKAYAAYVNSRGGIDGHKLNVLTCNEKNNPAGAAGCAHTAVVKHVAAVVGSYSQYGEQFMAPLEAADIPFIGGYGISQQEFTSYLSYPVNGGEATLLAGNGQQLAGTCDTTALVRPDTAAGDDDVSLLDTGLATGGHTDKATDVRAPEDATDYSRQAEAAREAAGDDGCVTALLGDHTSTFFDSYRRLDDGLHGIRVSSVVGNVDQNLINSEGGADGVFKNALVTGWYPEIGDPAWKEMKTIISKEAFDDDQLDPQNAGVQTTYIAFTVLKQVIEAIHANDITPGGIITVLNHGLTVKTGGLTPPLRWRYQDMLGAPGYPRIVNRDVTFQVVHDGRLVAQQHGFVNVGSALIKSNAG